MSRRGETRTGRPALLPHGPYTPPSELKEPELGELTIAFHGEDGRSATFRVDELPLPGWHEPLAAAWATRIGPAGTLRTLASACANWGILRRFVGYLASLPHPPTDPSALTAAQVEGFYEARSIAVASSKLGSELQTIGMLLRVSPLREMVPGPTLAAAARRSRRNHAGRSKPGYSDRELARLMTAARRDVAATRDRIAAGERLLATLSAERDADLAEARVLASVAETGVIPTTDLAPLAAMRPRRERAGQLFVIWPDVTPLLVLLVAMTGRNVETIKELPAEHRIIEGRAVELRVTKRRRGARRWTESVTWEIGPPHRELHTPGGLYLLLHRLCARSREFSGTAHVWAIWRNGLYAHVTGAAEHFDPFSRGLHTDAPHLRIWVAGHNLRSDDPAETAGAEARPLSVDFNRLKTSIDVRRTRQMGGHLPSSARSNSVPVLFSNYLRDDPTTIDWARDIIGDAVLDAEQAALEAHRRALAAAGGGAQLAISPTASGPDAVGPGGIGKRQEAGWSSCANPDQHPGTGTTCEASFLECFHCGNCLITPIHLPRLLALLEALQARRAQIPLSDWWARYGPVWAAIRHDVLPKFSPAELADAAAGQLPDALLDLVETPWEQP